MTKRERIAAYQEAARQIAEGESKLGCCTVIHTLCSVDEMRRFYTSAISPSADPSFYWWPIRRRQPRVLALLLAAEMVRTGDL